MRFYLVGGAIRDTLLGLPVKDRDYVVVGARPNAMLAAGFRPVGQDFPVFLHPVSQEAYALARSERKVSPGYAGFHFHTAPEVTLEQDLARRDLTINAMAQAVNQKGEPEGPLIDPYGGRQDLEQKILRHVSPAFVEDPVRLLRLARFAARFPAFSIAAPTEALMQTMVANGEVDSLVAERVWRELALGIMEVDPVKMLWVLHNCGALARLAPELDSRNCRPVLRLRQSITSQPASLAARFALLSTASLQNQDPSSAQAKLKEFCRRLRAPKDCSALACTVLNQYERLVSPSSPTQLVELFDACDAWRRPERLDAVLQVSACSLPHTKQKLVREIRQAYDLACQVDTAEIAAAHSPPDIRSAIKAARIAAIGLHS
jgi:tRNA nucleotidyltransferase (CCA-adding enzyme)